MEPLIDRNTDLGLLDHTPKTWDDLSLPDSKWSYRDCTVCDTAFSVRKFHGICVCNNCGSIYKGGNNG